MSDPDGPIKGYGRDSTDLSYFWKASIKAKEPIEPGIIEEFEFEFDPRESFSPGRTDTLSIVHLYRSLFKHL